MRLNQRIVERLLALNEGFEETTHYRSKNFTESRMYRIVDGVLHYRCVGNTSRADSRFDKPYVADAEQTRRFLRSVLGKLRTDGLD